MKYIFQNLKLISHSSLYKYRYYCSGYKSVRRPNLDNNLHKSQTQNQIVQQNGENVKNFNLTKQLRSRILATGPITVADYMREVLTNPLSGYYMQRDVFGKEGDFITSPEISQIFGELIAIWLITEWQKLGSPTPFQFVELGPGRGTLARDVLRVLSKFKLNAEFSIHLVEISPFLSQIQAQRLCFEHKQYQDDSLTYYQAGTTASGISVYWHKQFEDVPKGFSLILAHEFFDALPVHKLQRVGDTWQEVLIDVNDFENEKNALSSDFRLVLSKTPTPVSRIYKPLPNETRESLEYCIDGDLVIRTLCERIACDGGISLIMDYGHMGDKCDTFRAFKQHQLHDPLVEPGSADLTADVDFRHLTSTVQSCGGVVCYGPVEQGIFLKRMQGEVRLEQLLQHALPENQKTIRQAYDMLTKADQMGQRFKFLSIFPATVSEHLTKFPVNGF